MRDAITRLLIDTPGKRDAYESDPMFRATVDLMVIALPGVIAGLVEQSVARRADAEAQRAAMEHWVPVAHTFLRHDSP